MLDTSQYRRRREDTDHSPTRGIVPGRRMVKDRRTSPKEMLAEVEADLLNARFLRFSAKSENAFESARAPERIRHFVHTLLIGLLIYNLFLVTDYLMLPDVFLRSVMIHFCFVTPVGLLTAFLMHRRSVRVESVAAVILLILMTTLYVAYISHAPDAVFLCFTMPLMVLFSNIILPLPFRLAAVFTAVVAVATVWCVCALPGTTQGVRLFAVLLDCNIGVFTLAATYRLERSERKSYLLTLRETLRGEALVEQNRELSGLTETDGLTGIPNRRAFDRSLETLWNEHLQSRTPIALLLIDIDHFKRLNDTYGHANGDVCLRKTADRLNRLMRPHQSIARYGGEEFAVLLEGEGAYQAEVVAERLRAEVEAMPVILVDSDNEPHHITISIGSATAIPRVGLSPAELFLAADKALYEAKEAGRNRVYARTLEPARGSRASDSRASGERSAQAITFAPAAKN